MFSIQKTTCFFAVLVALAVVSISLFGISHTLGMQMKDNGTMSGCLFDGQAEICPMTIAEHLNAWQGMFTVIPQEADFLIVLFILIFAVGVLLLFNLRWRLFLLLFSSLSDRWRLYLKQNPHLSLFNLLRESFSQGILNPKIYEFAIL